jgi:diguanylate cyclase (GGDEF)-like protein
MLVFLLLIRSGWSQRLRDPSMTRLQMISALAAGAMAYPMAGELRMLALPMMMLILAFGMFELRGRVVTAMAWAGLAMLAAAMLFSHWVWPRRYAPAQELATAIMALASFSAMAVLTGRLSRIRQRLTQQREQLNEALAHNADLASRDVLTGLHNRRHGEQQLLLALQRQQRQGTPLALAMIDLDHFKSINDRHGHAVGDAVLQAFARAAQPVLRGTDLLVRWGGEEFLLMLEADRPEVASVALQRLRDAVQGCTVPAEGQALGFRFSAGLTQARRGEDAETLLRRADAALYAAKQQGRDRIVQA